MAPFRYRSASDLDDLWMKLRIDPPTDDVRSRRRRALTLVEECNNTATGRSGLPAGVESLVEALLEPGEHKTETIRELDGSF